MNGEIEEKITSLRERLDEADMYLGEPATPENIESLKKAAQEKFSAKLPDQYLEFLSKFDGLVSEGVFIYSSRPHKFPDSDGYSHDFITTNEIARDVDSLKNFLIFGDSDQDEYVLDIKSRKFQVRDKQAFDNIFEEFDSFDHLLDFMIDLIIQRV